MPAVLISKSSSVYLIMFLIFVAGTWMILEYGSTLLHAREDLAGQWELTPELATESAAIQKMQIEQSGQYFNISLPGSKPLNLVMTDEKIVDERFGEHKIITLASHGEMLQFEGTVGGNLWRMTRSGGDVQGEWVARLVDRTYPKPAVVQKPAMQPSVPSTTQPISQPPQQLSLGAHAR